MKRLLPAILPSTLALVGFLLVVVSEKAHRVYQPCPLAPIRVVARCGGTAPGPLEPRYLLFGALGGAALGAWIALAAAGRQLRRVIVGVALCLTVASVSVHRWAASVNHPTMQQGTVEPAGTTTVPPAPG